MRDIINIIKSKNNENGMALVAVLLVIVVLTVMGTALMGLAASNVKMSSGERNSQSAFYIAESGVTYKMNEINAEVLSIYSNYNTAEEFFTHFETEVGVGTNQPYSNFDNSFGQNPRANILVKKIKDNSPTSKDYKITSVGTIDNNSTRTVEKTFNLTWKEKSIVEFPTDHAVFVKSTMNLSGNTHIKGDIGSQSSSFYSITLNDYTHVQGSVGVNVSPPESGIRINSSNVKIDSKQTISTTTNFLMPEWEFPSAPTTTTDYIVSNNDKKNLPMNTVLSYNSLKVEENGVLNIAVDGEKQVLVVNNFEVIDNGTINISGGKLILYVMGNISFGGNTSINKQTNIDNLEIFVKESNPAKTISTSGNTKIYGSLYAENANISITGNTGFQGHIITGGTTVYINGNSESTTRLFYAPNANVTLEGDTHLKGSLIANSLVSKDAKVTYAELNTESLPLLPGNQSEVTSITELITKQDPTREK